VDPLPFPLPPRFSFSQKLNELARDLPLFLCGARRRSPFCSPVYSPPPRFFSSGLRRSKAFSPPPSFSYEVLFFPENTVFLFFFLPQGEGEVELGVLPFSQPFYAFPFPCDVKEAFLFFPPLLIPPTRRHREQRLFFPFSLSFRSSDDSKEGSLFPFPFFLRLH